MFKTNKIIADYVEKILIQTRIGNLFALQIWTRQLSMTFFVILTISGWARVVHWHSTFFTRLHIGIKLQASHNQKMISPYYSLWSGAFDPLSEMRNAIKHYRGGEKKRNCSVVAVLCVSWVNSYVTFQFDL